MPPTISIIIPCWRDDEMLLSRAWLWAKLPHVEEVIIVTASVTSDLKSDSLVRIVVAEQPNRGQQMNLGAQSAKGEILIFQHADSELQAEHLAALGKSFSTATFVGGAFHRAFDARHAAFRWVRHFERWRNQHYGSFFGDQSIFVRADHFQALGGFRDFPLMEDMEFSRRLRRSGKIILLDPPMVSSARRHLQRGAWRTSLQNGLFILLYHLGVSPFTLHRWYYSLKQT